MTDKLNKTSGEPSVKSGDEQITGTPLWVKVFGVVTLALVLLFVALHLTGNSPGGPGSHGLPMNNGM